MSLLGASALPYTTAHVTGDSDRIASPNVTLRVSLASHNLPLDGLSNAVNAATAQTLAKVIESLTNKCKSGLITL